MQDISQIVDRVRRIINELDVLWNEVNEVLKCSEVSRIAQVFRNEHSFITRRIFIELLNCGELLSRIDKAREELKQLLNELSVVNHLPQSSNP